MKKIVIIIILLVSVSVAFAQKSDPSKFNKDLSTIKATFNLPSGFEPVDIISNRQLSYDFAMKNKKEEFEVRYKYYPITKKSNARYPNTNYKGLLMANLRNFAKKSVSSLDFPDAGAKKEFGADKGKVSVMFEFGAELGKTYKHGQVIMIHKDNVADIMIVFMTNDASNHLVNMRKAFYAVKFK